MKRSEVLFTLGLLLGAEDRTNRGRADATYCSAAPAENDLHSLKVLDFVEYLLKLEKSGRDSFCAGA
jgi:hypothetical protein